MVTDEGEKDLPLAEVQAGMILRLTTGDRVPVDGVISQGEAWFDEAMLTGEPVPQQKGDGDAVHAGTVVQDGSILFTASAVGSQTTLARIIRMVRQAQSSKPDVGRLADRISADLDIPFFHIAEATAEDALALALRAGADVHDQRARPHGGRVLGGGEDRVADGGGPGGGGVGEGTDA